MPRRSTTHVTLRLPTELLQRLERAYPGSSRTDAVRAALETALATTPPEVVTIDKEPATVSGYGLTDELIGAF